MVIAGILAEIGFAAILTRKRFYRCMPFFYSYISFAVCNDLLMYVIQHRYPLVYMKAFVVQTSVDSALQFGILVELAWCVLRPVRASLPRGTVAGISVLILAVGAMAWPFCYHPKLPQPWQFVAILEQSTAILRILFFLVLAGGSHLLALGWRDRELQVATGLGSYSLVSLAATLVHAHQRVGAPYHWVDIIVAFSYVGSLGYWLVSFVQAEAPRREFTPQMRSVLLAVAGTARASSGARSFAVRD